MIHDAKVDVSCDGEGCGAMVEVQPEYKFHDYSGKSGYYDTKDSAIEARLVADENWIVKDGKHYCSDECVPTAS